MRIRSANSKDKNFLVKVCRDAKRVYSDIMPQAFENQAKKFENEGVPKKYNVYIVQKKNGKIGFIGIKELNKNIIYLAGLYLLSNQQRKGYGKEIIEKLIKRYKKQGYEEITLLVHKDAYWAISFYKKNNFKVETDNMERIKKYADGAMEEFAISSTILMKKIIK